MDVDFLPLPPPLLALISPLRCTHSLSTSIPLLTIIPAGSLSESHIEAFFASLRTPAVHLLSSEPNEKMTATNDRGTKRHLVGGLQLDEACPMSPIGWLRLCYTRPQATCIKSIEVRQCGFRVMRSHRHTDKQT